MVLYLVQHGEAKREEEDPARELTDKGRRDITKVAGYLGKFLPPVSRIFHSGKTRAVSTASILAASLNPTPTVEAAVGLAPQDGANIWAAQLDTMDETVMLVGHLPHLAKLAARLIVADEQKNVVNFKMAGVVCLRRETGIGHWVVEWMIIPELVADS